MIVSRYVLLLSRKLRQLLLDLHQRSRHGVGTALGLGLYVVCLLYDLLDQKILHHLAGGLIIVLKIGPDMALRLVDAADDLPLALMDAVVTDKALVLALPVKDLHLQAHVLVGQVL